MYISKKKKDVNVNLMRKKKKDVNVINGGKLLSAFLLGLITQDFDKIVTIQ